VSNPTHPKCGKSYPGGPTAGHCSGCCETFIGLGAFEKHRVGDHGPDRHCEITADHWTDNRGFYHVGAKLTAERKLKMWGPKE
jgi:hypothetical protein